VLVCVSVYVCVCVHGMAGAGAVSQCIYKCVCAYVSVCASR